MDPVLEIKARLPIEELVRQYCQLHKKGRNFVCLCPFHNDSHPSFLVSPDKGIAYCFACQSGGDIFSFYQKIEHVDFPQAIRDLAEKVGVQLPKDAPKGPDRDEKERARACLDDAIRFYAETLKKSPAVLEYLKGRGVTDEEISEFAIGVAPEGFTNTYDEMLRRGHSRSDIIQSGLAVQKNLNEERCYDRFHNRLMFPIHDNQARVIGFGGRTLGNDDAKYMNSSDGPLFHKSQVLFNHHRAKESMRQSDSVIVVEGYFDVLAVRRVGAQNVVATCGTALTAEHAKILKRAVSKVILCLDSDRAGKDAAERAFLALAAEGLQVMAVVLPKKDPADLAQSEPQLLSQLLGESKPYIDLVLEDLRQGDLRSASGKRAALERLRPLLLALQTSVERSHYRNAAANALQVTDAELEQDLKQTPRAPTVSHEAAPPPSNLFSAAEIALGLLFLYPAMRNLLEEIIPPEEPFATLLYEAMKSLPADQELTADALALEPEAKERVSILQLFCEQHAFGTWSELLAPREIRRNILSANRELLRKKQREISDKLMAAQKGGKQGEEELLRTQYQQLLKLAHMAR